MHLRARQIRREVTEAMGDDPADSYRRGPILPPERYEVERVVEIDAYDGLSTGLIVLGGGDELLVAVRRVGVSASSQLCIGRLLPRKYRRAVMEMGEPLGSARNPFRYFTTASPMDPDLIASMSREAGQNLYLVLGVDERWPLLAIGIVDRVLDDGRSLEQILADG